MNKIFEIGVSKTGTSSLEAAYKMLGFKAIGWNSELYTNFMETGDYKPLFEVINRFDAFQDGPWHDCDFRVLDRMYPNSKFIILERDDVSWVRSKEWHESPVFNINRIKSKHLFQEWIEDKQKYIQTILREKHEKYAKIIRYFRNRQDDLLVLNICGGEGWERLCPFLGRPIIKRKFPKKNPSIKKNDKSQAQIHIH